MKKKRFTETQIIKILKEYENGRDLQQLCREYGVARATFYNWRKRYSGMDSAQLKKLKNLEEENRKLKQMFADLSLDHALLKEVLEKSFKALRKERESRVYPFRT